MRITAGVKVIVGLMLGLILVTTAGTWGYIHFVNGRPPARLGIDTPSSTTVAPTTSTSGEAVTSGVPAGTWKVTSGSQAGYRVNEVLFGQSATAVGRTTEVAGAIVIDGTNVTSGSFTVDLTSVASNESRRDSQFRGRIMDVSTYPTATFKLTKAISLGTLPGDGQQIAVKATGDLTVHGVTRSVTIELQAQRSGSTIKVAGTAPVVFSDYGIPNPSFGPAQTEDHGEIEFLLVLAA
jgi:polyisoprenoid-binding protein YceI